MAAMHYKVVLSGFIPSDNTEPAAAFRDENLLSRWLQGVLCINKTEGTSDY